MVDPEFKSFAFKPSSQVKYYLVNSLDTQKRFELKSNYAIDFYLFDKFHTDDSLLEYSSTWFSGFPAGIGDSTITIDMWQENEETFFEMETKSPCIRITS